MTITRRITAALAGLALAVGMLGLAGPASADDDRYDSTPSVTLTAQQVTAVTAARNAYLTAAGKAKDAYRVEAAKIKDAQDASLADERLTLLLARDAWLVATRYGGDTTATKAALDSATSAYRSASSSARATARTQSDAAKATLRTALDKARADYTAAITAAFAGTSVPRGLQNPPGLKLGWDRDDRR